MSLITRTESSVGLDPRSRHLPATTPSGFVVGSAEPVAPALRRVTTEQFTIAMDALTDPGADFELAATVARRSLQRIAAVLRLVRGPIGPAVYRSEARVLREVNAQLADLLANDGALRALDELRLRYSSVLRPESFVRFREELIRAHQLKQLRALAETEVAEEIEETLHRLRRARARFAAWDAADETSVDSAPVPDSFEAFADGLERTYRRGRRRWKAAAAGEHPNPRRWERDVRELGDQLELIAASWPEVIAAAAGGCRDLAATLSDEVGYTALERAVDRAPLTHAAEHSLLESLSHHTRGELAEVSAALGARVYAETPAAFVTRIGSYWATRR